MENFDKTLTEKDVVQSPADCVLDAVILQIQRAKLEYFIPKEVHDKFENLDQETLLITFETKYNDKVFKGTDRLAYYEEPMSNSLLGKFLTKYKTLQVGKQIKVAYNSKGHSKISVE